MSESKLEILLKLILENPHCRASVNNFMVSLYVKN